jgi:lipid II:glycine glycyltransferase (peptidoglycan interpeptide bridge formation enzyme)
MVPLLIDRLPEALGLPADLKDARSPDGYPGPLFVGAPTEIRAALHDLMAFLRSERITTCFIRAHPLFGLETEAFEEIGSVVDRGWTVQIVLDSSYEQIVQRMRYDHRSQIGRALEAGYSVAFDRWDLLPEFVSLYRALMDRVDAAGPYRFSDGYFERYRAVIGDSAHIAVALAPDGRPTAGALFTLCCGVLQYHLAAGDRRFAKHAVSKLVIDGLVRFGLDHRAKTLHLGGGVGARSDSLLKFKQGFSRSELDYRTIHLIPDEAANREAEEAWKAQNGGDRTHPDFFPLYRAPSPR